jgi:hypothetical protein
MYQGLERRWQASRDYLETQKRKLGRRDAPAGS